MAESKRIGIIAAMKTEIEKVASMITDRETRVISGIAFHSGKIYGTDVVVAQCGIGKVFAAMCAQTMILEYKPDCIINMGVGGSLCKELNVADVAVADRVVQYDMDTTAIGDPLGLVSGINKIYFEADPDLGRAFTETIKDLGINTKTGVIASGDLFVNDSKVKKHIVDNFDGIVCEMEGGAIGHVCYVNNTKFAIIRSVSDNGDENSDRVYADSLDRACAAVFTVVDEFLKRQ